MCCIGGGGHFVKRGVVRGCCNGGVIGLRDVETGNL